MTGPEHYLEAERLEAEGRQVVAAIKAIRRGQTADWREQRDDRGKQAAGIWAQAQVHATLALAAATALDPVTSPSCAEWLRLAGEQS